MTLESGFTLEDQIKLLEAAEQKHWQDWERKRPVTSPYDLIDHPYTEAVVNAGRQLIWYLLHQQGPNVPHDPDAVKLIMKKGGSVRYDSDNPNDFWISHITRYLDNTNILDVSDDAIEARLIEHAGRVLPVIDEALEHPKEAGFPGDHVYNLRDKRACIMAYRIAKTDSRGLGALRVTRAMIDEKGLVEKVA